MRFGSVHLYFDILGQRIRAKCKELEMFQKRLAHEAGMDRSYVGLIDRGDSDLTFVALVELCPISDL